MSKRPAWGGPESLYIFSLHSSFGSKGAADVSLQTNVPAPSSPRGQLFFREEDLELSAFDSSPFPAGVHEEKALSLGKNQAGIHTQTGSLRF